MLYTPVLGSAPKTMKFQMTTFTPLRAAVSTASFGVPFDV